MRRVPDLGPGSGLEPYVEVEALIEGEAEKPGHHGVPAVDAEKWRRAHRARRHSRFTYRLGPLPRPPPDGLPVVLG